jgi:glutathione peroxidase
MKKNTVYTPILGVLMLTLLTTTVPAQTQPLPDLYEISVQDMTGKTVKLEAYKGQVLLIVNVASKCGLTPQYKELQALYETHRDRGFTILAFPANNFRDQEPGSNEEIRQFCSDEYGVTFPLFAKISVGGDDIHPLYRLLTKNGGPIRWNFDKFLVSADGKTIQRFEPKTKPLAEELVETLEKMLKPAQLAQQDPVMIKPPCCL